MDFSRSELLLNTAGQVGVELELNSEYLDNAIKTYVTQSGLTLPSPLFRPGYTTENRVYAFEKSRRNVSFSEAYSPPVPALHWFKGRDA
jgi:hypothetical protein